MVVVRDNIIPFKKRRISKGIIMSGAGGVSNENGIVAKSLSNADLMFYGLYWDKIAITQIPMFHFTNDIIEQFRSNGVVEFYQNAPPESMHSSQMQKLALESLISCQSVRAQEENSDWLIYNNVSNGFNHIKSKNLLETHSIRVEIASCLPYPSTHVPIDQLRRFREDYIDELDRLHIAKYRMFNEISNHDNFDRRELARKYQIQEFDNALKDYQAAFASKFPHYSLNSLISDIKSNQPSLWEVAATVGDAVISNSFTLSGLYMLTKTTLNMFGSKQKIHETKLNSPEFQFISSGIDKGIIIPDIN